MVGDRGSWWYWRGRPDDRGVRDWYKVLQPVPRSFEVLFDILALHVRIRAISNDVEDEFSTKNMSWERSWRNVGFLASSGSTARKRWRCQGSI